MFLNSRIVCMVVVVVVVTFAFDVPSLPSPTGSTSLCSASEPSPAAELSPVCFVSSAGSGSGWASYLSSS
uniref:Putative secreted protein n=1 Tax=Anopheles darlingi TaxID=43151 RepID=A0A2M4DII7_ANODA